MGHPEGHRPHADPEDEAEDEDVKRDNSVLRVADQRRHEIH